MKKEELIKEFRYTEKVLWFIRGFSVALIVLLLIYFSLIIKLK